MADAQLSEQETAGANPIALSAKVRELLAWFLQEAAPVIDDGKFDWKVVIHSLPGGKTKAIIEKHLTI